MMQKNEYMGRLLVLLLMCAWVLSGCGGQDGYFYETAQNADAGSTEASAEDDKSVRNMDAAAGNAADTGGDTAAGNAAGTGGDAAAGNSADRGADDVSESARQQCYVHICGAVLYPGVYEVPEGSRLYEVIVLAGGLCADACDYLVNQAQIVNDGMQVYIPTMQEAQEGNAGQVSFADPVFQTEREQESGDTRIDLNSATKEQLMTLPGVGETRAQAIIAYREAHGGFQTIEELMEVSGIKQGVYDRLKEMIKV